MKIPVVRRELVHHVPRFAHEGDAGADLFSSDAVTIDPGRWELIGTGVSVAIPFGFAGFVLPRSGVALREGVTVLNAPGLIDAGYRGEVKVTLINHSENAFDVTVGDRIAQLVLMAVPAVEFVEVESLDDTERGTGGFGSTGVRGD